MLKGDQHDSSRKECLPPVDLRLHASVAHQRHERLDLADHPSASCDIPVDLVLLMPKVQSMSELNELLMAACESDLQRTIIDGAVKVGEMLAGAVRRRRLQTRPATRAGALP